MSKQKMMPLVAGTLTALAIVALAGTASAKETHLKCEGTGACTFSVSGFPTNISLAAGDTVKCSSVLGNGEVTGLDAIRESTTGTVQLLFTDCREKDSGFNFTCSNTKSAGNITTSTMTMHFVGLTALSQAGVLMTNAGVTFTCAGGFAATQLTGNLIGEYESGCNFNTGSIQGIRFSTFEHGAQSLTIYTGSIFRLEGKAAHSNPESAYLNAALSGSYNFSFNQNVILTCS
jgi:hypothetical protein